MIDSHHSSGKPWLFDHSRNAAGSREKNIFGFGHISVSSIDHIVNHLRVVSCFLSLP